MSDTAPAIAAAPNAPPQSAEAPITRYTSKQVLSGFWRAMVAIKDALALVFLLMFFMLLFGLLAGRPNVAGVITNGALVLKLDGTVSEQPAPMDPLSVFSANMPLREFRRADLVQALNAAATDNRVKAVVLDLDRFMGGGQVALGDVAAAIDTVRAANKPVLAYATAYGDDAYQLAAHASEVWTETGGGVIIAGPGGSRLYYKGLLDRFGITANIYRVGSFKSAVEPYLRSDQSPEAREAALAYANVLWDQWQQQVKRARPRAQMDQFIADPAAAMRANNNDLAVAARAAGLIDRIGTRMQFERRVAEIAGVRNNDRPWTYNRIRLDNYVAANPVAQRGERIAIVPVVGEIVDGRADAGTAGGETVAQHILDAVSDAQVKAIVLRVDSPGGSVLASERIRSALLEAKAKRLPIVVSMANVAASGGYWVSTPADRIIAEPDTITGSIGVFAVLPSFERALGNIGITSDGIATTPLSGEPDILGGVGPAFDNLAQASVEHVYARFTGLVAQSRRMQVARVEEIAEGRVWAGATARQLGLIDQFGGLEDAMKVAAQLARIDPEAIYPVYFEDGPDPFTAWLSQFRQSDPDDATAPAGWFGQVAWLRQARMVQVIADARRLISSGGVQASCLECRDWMAPPAMSAAERRQIFSLIGL